MAEIQLKERWIGEGHPCYIIGEIGINHNGDLDNAFKLIDVAAWTGCDAVKFQKRTPDLCVPEAQKDILRETPWGLIPYIEYKYKVEFGQDEFEQIDAYCKKKNIHWFASAWDIPSYEFMEQFAPPCHKIASASITDIDLLKAHSQSKSPIMMSSGMSSMEEIEEAFTIFGKENTLIAHSTSIYPCPLECLNLNMILTLKEKFGVVTGYSGHEVGLSPSFAAVVLGANFLERHITLDRAMWGSDHSASVEPHGLQRLVSNIRDIEKSLGDGVKVVYEQEAKAKARLRSQ